MFQYYLRAEGVALSWVGTGRLIFSLNYSERDFELFARALLCGGQAMQKDGWWWQDAALTNKAIKRRVLREMLAAAFDRAPASVKRWRCGPAGSYISPRRSCSGALDRA